MNEREERKRAFDTVVEYLPETLFVADPQFEEFPYISKPLSAIASRPVEGLQSLSDLWTRFIAPGDREPIQSQIRELVDTGDDLNVQFRVVPPGETDSERYLWFELRVVPVAEPDGGVTHYAGVILDRTDQKRSLLNAARAQEQEIFIGAQIQRSLLLAQPMGETKGARIAAQTLPSQSIDGDFYDFYQYSEGILDFVIGDVMGKGISAALMGAAAKSAFIRAMLDETVASGGIPEIHNVVARTEQQLSRKLMEIGRFVTMYVCRLDMDHRCLDYVDCGHTYVIHYDSRTESTWAFEGNNMPIGFTERQTFATKRMPLRAGDLLFFYSDGLTESRNSEDQFFGEERIMYYLQSHNEGPPEAILSGLLRLVFDFSVTDLNDDVTAIMIRIDENEERIEGEIAERSFPVAEHMMTDSRAFVSEAVERRDLPVEEHTKILFAVHEAVANIWVHQYQQRAPLADHITMTIEIRDAWLYVTISYNGTPYELYGPSRDLAEEISTEGFRENGYGLQVIRAIMDSVVLTTGLDGRIRLVMAKQILP